MGLDLMMGGKPVQSIPTTYRGIVFRSVLEAKWARTFDEIHLAWKYEPVCLMLHNGGRYIPDFYLPQSGQFFEVKGKVANPHIQQLLDLDGTGELDVVMPLIDQDESESVEIRRLAEIAGEYSRFIEPGPAPHFPCLIGLGDGRVVGLAWREILQTFETDTVAVLIRAVVQCECGREWLDPGRMWHRCVGEHADGQPQRFRPRGLGNRDEAPRFFGVRHG